MKFSALKVVGPLFALALTSHAYAQSASVHVGTSKQRIRGYGGMVHTAWTGASGDLTAAERTLAFGNADGQLGFTILRIPVTDGSPDSVNLADAQAAVAAGAIVYATPWNGSGSMNSSQFATYATHLNDFVAYMKGKGVDLYAIGVQNEPDYATEGGWRSWTAAQCHDFILNYGATITTKLISCESFNYAKGLYEPTLNDAAALKNMAILGTHLYGTPVSGYSYPLADSKAPDKERWMTEHYTDSNTDANSWPNALNVATELHHAMVEGSFNVYTWWYIKRSYGPINNGAVTKRGWCMAHWSKFVRPGAYRVDATASPTSGVYVSAYKSATDVVIVIVNTNASAKSLSVTVDGTDISAYERYTTSSTKSLAKEASVSASGGALSLSLDASSVTTLRGAGTIAIPSDVPSTGGSTSGGAGSAGGSTLGGSTNPRGSGGAASTASVGLGGTKAAGDATSTAVSLGGAKSTGAVGGATSTAVSLGGAKSTDGAVGNATSTGAASGTGAFGTSTNSAATMGGSVSATHQPTNAGGAAATGPEGTNRGSGAAIFDGTATDSSGCSCVQPGRLGSRSMTTWGVFALLLACSARRRTRR
jgi:glucuronoarabinoxylan endo-1,4-beta-xylanase